jgi:hypothetical protein
MAEKKATTTKKTTTKKTTTKPKAKKEVKELVENINVEEKVVEETTEKE